MAAPAPPEGPAAIAGATGTRERVLQLAWTRIAEQGEAALSLVDLAKAAGVSRQTLYLLFGSRAGLLLALVAQHDALSGIGPRLARLRQGGTPREMFAPYLRAWFDYLAEVYPVARALIAATSAGDSDAHSAWQSRMALLRAGYGQMCGALQASGALRAGWTPAAAADWLYTQTHVDTWQHLVVEAGWPPAEAAARLVATLSETLLTPA